MEGESPQCEEDDRLLEKWTSIRFIGMGAIMLYRAWMIRSKGLKQSTEPNEMDLPYREHPKLTQQMNSANIVFGLAIAVCIFIQSEGVGLVIYFGTSALLDNVTVYLVDLFQYCEYVMQVSLYSMAVITFLPCVLVSYSLQGRWYEKGQWQGLKSAFILLMILAAASSFAVRLLLVFKLGWDTFIDGLLRKTSLRVVIAIAVPPLVDALQTAALVAASLLAPSGSEYLGLSQADKASDNS